MKYMKYIFPLPSNISIIDINVAESILFSLILLIFDKLYNTDQ